jgi:DNA-binding transcriptional LysR family regulator
MAQNRTPAVRIRNGVAMRHAQQIEWDDLRYILAVAESGSISAAGKQLHVDRTTVLRRINAFERGHRVRLFERLPSGYELTQAGTELLEVARGMQNTVTALERRLAGRDSQLEGTIRLTTTDTLLSSVLAPALVSFKAAHAAVTLDINVSNAMLDLVKRDADIAVRPAPDPPPALVGRRVAALAFAVYGSTEYLQNHGAETELGSHRWIAPSASLASTSVARWMNNTLSRAADFHADSLLAMREIAASGAGLAALPCYLGDLDARLARATAPIAQMTTVLWILTHADLARTARIHSFIEFVGSALVRERPLLEGRRPRIGRDQGLV